MKQRVILAPGAVSMRIAHQRGLDSFWSALFCWPGTIKGNVFAASIIKSVTH
jgi:hypothetical protein